MTELRPASLLADRYALEHLQAADYRRLKVNDDGSVVVEDDRADDDEDDEADEAEETDEADDEADEADDD